MLKSVVWSATKLSNKALSGLASVSIKSAIVKPGSVSCMDKVSLGSVFTL